MAVPTRLPPFDSAVRARRVSWRRALRNGSLSIGGWGFKVSWSVGAIVHSGLGTGWIYERAGKGCVVPGVGSFRCTDGSWDNSCMR